MIANGVNAIDLIANDKNVKVTEKEIDYWKVQSLTYRLPRRPGLLWASPLDPDLKVNQWKQILALRIHNKLWNSYWVAVCLKQLYPSYLKNAELVEWNSKETDYYYILTIDP